MNTLLFDKNYFYTASRTLKQKLFSPTDAVNDLSITRDRLAIKFLDVEHHIQIVVQCSARVSL